MPGEGDMAHSLFQEQNKFYNTLTLNENELHVCHFILNQACYKESNIQNFLLRIGPNHGGGLVIEFGPNISQCVLTALDRILF